MVHNHELTIREKNLITNDAIISEIELYLDCSLSNEVISKLVHRKFDVAIKQSDINMAIKFVK
jgi:hypothetical protein